MFVDTIVDYNRKNAGHSPPPSPPVLTHFYWVSGVLRITEHKSLVIDFLLYI